MSRTVTLGHTRSPRRQTGHRHRPTGRRVSVGCRAGVDRRRSGFGLSLLGHGVVLLGMAWGLGAPPRPAVAVPLERDPLALRTIVLAPPLAPAPAPAAAPPALQADARPAPATPTAVPVPVALEPLADLPLIEPAAPESPPDIPKQAPEKPAVRAVVPPPRPGVGPRLVERPVQAVEPVAPTIPAAAPAPIRHGNRGTPSTRDAAAATAANRPASQSSASQGVAAPVQDPASRSLVLSASYRVEPEYPRRARRLGQEGTVELAVLVGADGSVARVELAESSGFALLDEAAIAAVRNWRFAVPAEPIATAGLLGTTRISVCFRLT